ncbi:hypothetical protein NLX71_09795 [Paenibacillus sp. MZ04-78.2]|uniref:hypothetical protein n=1 Tax=Paenibacillus sp. MZ04-78.2 TaxID=2962034 RepID=UPI0020B6BB9E|nr:hypothetical protein [Paenibacillus sp. MZ04-78.2]MCP3773601.1 hypothetical protein [Paenibacillus sp. MZ04-78.2]
MKSLFKGIVTIVILVALLAAGALWYAQPQAALDLSYNDLPVREKLAAMVTNLKPEAVLTEQEVGDLLKKALARKPELRPGVKLTGAKFFLKGERLAADVTLLLQDRWKVGARLNFDLAWNEPYLTAVHTGTVVRDVTVPGEWLSLEPIQVDLNGYMPKHVAIRNVAFEGSTARVTFGLRL